MGLLYTLYDVASEIIIQGGDVPSPDCYPPIPEGAAMLYGVMGTRGIERVVNGQLVPFEEPKEDPELLAIIDKERDRRMRDEFTFNGVAYQIDDKAINRINAMGAMAKFAKMSGAQQNDYLWAGTNDPFGWIATDNTVTPMDAYQMSDFADAAFAWVFKLTFHARSLKDMNPLPQDPQNPDHWSFS